MGVFMFARRCGVFVAAVAVGVGCAACGGSPAAGQAPASAAAAALTADQVGAAVMAAAHGASAVHVRGTVKDGSTTMKIDVQLNKDSAAGTIIQGDTTIPVRRVGSVYYAQMTDGVITMAGLSPKTMPGPLMRDKWVSSQSKLGADLVEGSKSFLSYDEFVANTAGQIRTASLTAAGSDTVNGVPVLVFRQSDGSTADVTTAAPHYLVRMADDTGGFDFSGWDQQVAVAAPSAGELYSGPGA
ncbi:hypothetical protein HFP15_21410 [Amycolatopsis sp. K13G38]|uniref:LppX_LprAFG lipoprotein n=1 Tax=Amycolatopsis acididurans TaxID=2724524 RepID=A0ABX1JA75_9PSEU|nr:hypothetical protein [Amycolatopsis acididurans]NKQ55445.1 hypothetical protein [Amycolatopsis acididurans]